MAISYGSLLEKMEAELRKARQTEDIHKRQGHIYAIKALAELALDERTESFQPEFRPPVPPPSMPVSPPVRNVYAAESKPMEMEDGANGDSLFDF